MNAAAKAINQSNLFSGRFAEMRLSKELFALLVLMFALLISSLAVIVVTNEDRLSFSQLEQLEQQNHQLKLEWGRLLLEQASLATPSRVEEMAVQQLRMRLPVDKDTYILQAK